MIATKIYILWVRDLHGFDDEFRIQGLVGPKHLIGSGSPFKVLLYGFLVGAAVPLDMWLLDQRFPKGLWCLINAPVMISGVCGIPPAVGMQHTAPILIVFLSQFVWTRSHSMTWNKYYYILAASLVNVFSTALVFIFFAVHLYKRTEPALSQLRMVGKLSVQECSRL